MSISGRLSQLVRSLARIGVTDADDDAARTQKSALTLAVCLTVLLSFAWVATYLALGIPASAAIPIGYQIASVSSLIALARTKRFRFFRISQAAMMLLLPFLLQWTLGGFVASSMVSLWAFVAVIGAVFFATPRESIVWFAGFVTLTLISAVLDPVAAEHAPAIPDAVRTGFFVLNLTAPTLTAYLLLRYAVSERDAAFARSEGLLLNILPRTIAQRLKRDPSAIAEAHDAVTVLFADVVDFTPLAERTEPHQLVAMLDEIFSAFDALAARHGLEKIKTIGDAYMVAAGIPEPRPDHAQAMAEMALEMQAVAGTLPAMRDRGLEIRVGMESGPVVAGVIGRRKFIYDLWGNTVNTASRLESHGLPGRIQVGETAYGLLRDRYAFEDRGRIELKGKGRRPAYLLLGRRPG
jgi:adenylate cyclase